MAYFVTGATGFVGRHLIQELVDNHDDEVFVLVRKGSQAKLDRLRHAWGQPGTADHGHRRPRPAEPRRVPQLGEPAPGPGAWSNVVSSELVGDGVSFTTIHMPLVRTPMIAPTRIYDRFPTITPAQAADLVLDALADKPHEINTALDTLGAVAHSLAPKTVARILKGVHW